MTQRRYTEIPKRQKCVNKEEPYIGGTEDIVDDTLGKPQSQVNQETNERVSALENKVGPGGSVDERIAVETRRAQDAEGFLQSEINGLNSQNYVTIAADNTWTLANINSLISTAAGADAEKVDTVYRVGNWDSSQYDETCYSEYAWNGSAYAHISTKSQTNDGVYDISAMHSGTTYADLAAALGTNGANVPASVRKGGMSVKFIKAIPATYNVIKTEDVEEAPSGGTLLESAPSIESGIYTASQLSAFVTLPESTSAAAVVYYVAVTVDETTTYTTWSITMATADAQIYKQWRYMGTSVADADFVKIANWQGDETIVQSTEDYTLTDLVWTDTGVRGLKNSSDFWLNSGDKLNFSYTASYGGIIQQKKSDGTYVSLFSTNDVRTLTAFEFICQVGGYYRFHVNSIANIVITPSYTADKKESISSATNSLSKQILDIESGISRCEEFLIESRFYAQNTGKVWNQATSELVSISNNGSSHAAIIEVEGVTDIHFKRKRWTPASYCPTFFSTKNSNEFNADTMAGYVSVNTANEQDEFYVPVPANAKVICISLRNDIVKSQNYFFRKYYNKEPAIKVKRTWASIGDSITRINNDNLWTAGGAKGSFTTTKGYQGYLQERIKFNGFTNLGVNGANSLTYPWDDITVADIYTIALGINDWGAGNAVGTISDYKEWASGDAVDNFAKGIARIVKKIRTLNAYADIVIMTPTKAITGYYPTSSNSPSDNGLHTYLHEYADMLIEIADYEGFPVADIYHHGNYNDGNIQYWTYDKCHPNDRGSRKIANLLFPVMRYFSDEYYTKN